MHRGDCLLVGQDAQLISAHAFYTFAREGVHGTGGERRVGRLPRNRTETGSWPANVFQRLPKRLISDERQRMGKQMEQTERNNHARTMKGIGAAAAAVAAVVALQSPAVAFADTGSGTASGKAPASQDADQLASPAPAAQAPAQPAGDATAASAHKEAAPASPAGQKGDAAAKDATSSAESDATAAAADLSSGTDGSYEDHGLYLVIVRYVDENGDQIAPSYQTELREGGSWHATSPSIGGYGLADASQKTLSGTAEGENHSPVYTVVYHSDLATYTVAVELQVGDGYRVARTEQRTARAGARVAAAPEDISGYHCVTGEADRTTTVTADGKAVIELRYDQDVPSYGVYFETGGSYVAPQTGHAGDALIAPAAPTKPGYSFAGWDLDGDGTADALPSTIPSYDLTAQAVWAPVQATYQVRYYLQRSGDEYGGEKHYGLSETRTLTGATESTTPAAERLDTSKGAAYQNYQYARETSAVIAGDGSTIVSVYYDLRSVTVRYYVSIDGTHVHDEDLIEKKTLLMHQRFWLPDEDTVMSYYKAHGGKASSFFGYLNNESGLLVSDDVSIIPADTVFTGTGELESTIVALFADGLVTSYIRNDYEGVTPGDYSEDFSVITRQWNSNYHINLGTGKPDANYVAVQWRCSKSRWDGKDESAIEWGPWQPLDESMRDSSGFYKIPGVNKGFDYVNQNVVEIRFARNSFTVTLLLRRQAGRERYAPLRRAVRRRRRRGCFGAGAPRWPRVRRLGLAAGVNHRRARHAHDALAECLALRDLEAPRRYGDLRRGRRHAHRNPDDRLGRQGVRACGTCA